MRPYGRLFSGGASFQLLSVLVRQRVARLLAAGRIEKLARSLTNGDPLTGLPNRTLFQKCLGGLLNHSHGDGQVHAILFVDLDRFKLVNDTLGHETGDLLLKAAAERIMGCVRTDDTVARLGDDEFSIVLVNVGSPKKAAGVAQKICQVLSQPFAFMGKETYISASIGITMFPNDGTDVLTLTRHGDVAMGRAKEAGNRFLFYEEEMGAAIAQRLALERDLRRALEQDQFLLYYQPQVDTGTGEVVGMEVLIRWQHPEQGLLLPDRFIPLAEETGLIVPIGEWVLRTACAQNHAWQAAGLPALPVAVNLSTRQLDQHCLEHTLAAILRDTGLDPRYLELELTESAVMQDPEEMLRRLHRLKAAGLMISMDDFGTGYSSLSYLKDFPFDKLKIDRSFIGNITSNPDDAAITRTIIAMGHALGLQVIAEGVESEGQLRYLRLHGCDHIQGHYFSKALTVDKMTALLKAGRQWPLVSIPPAEQRTLLIVDDDIEVTDALSRQLYRDDYEILTANSTTAAFELLATREIRVVISDQRMPGIQGVEFLRRVRELHPHTVRILLTAYAELNLVAQAVNEGRIYKFITKPWEVNRLREEVQEALAAYTPASQDQSVTPGCARRAVAG